MGPCRKQYWSTYALYIATYSPPAMVLDSLLALLLYVGSSSSRASAQTTALILFTLWLLLTKTVKLMPLFLRNPGDLLYLPVSILFGYFHGFIKFWAWWTRNDVSLSSLGLAPHPPSTSPPYGSAPGSAIHGKQLIFLASYAYLHTAMVLTYDRRPGAPVKTVI